MKKILSLLVLMAAFCVVGFAQSAPKTAKKAIMMGDNAQVKDVKTGQVLRVAKASKQVPSNLNGTIQMSGNGVVTPSNSTNPNSNKLKYIKDAQPCNNELKLKEGTKKSVVVGKAGEPAKNMKAAKDCNNELKMKGSVIKSSTNLQRDEPNKSSMKKHSTLPKNIVILKEQ